MKYVSLAIPDDMIYEIKSLPKKEATINDRLQSSLAIGMFVSGDISLAKAAQLSNKSLEEFMDMLKNFNIPSVTYTDEMLEEDLQFVKGATE